MEYYFNIEYIMSNKILKNKLHKYIESLNEENIKEKRKEWLVSYSKEYLKINTKNNLSYIDFLSIFQTIKKHNEQILLDEYLNSYQLLLYDKLLFLSKHFPFINHEEHFIQVYFEYLKYIVKFIR